MRHSTPRSTSDQTINGWARAVLKIADDSKLMQEITLDLFSGETQQTIEHVHPYGFTAVPQPSGQSGGQGQGSGAATGTAGKAAEAFVMFLQGNRSHGIAVVVGDRRYRLQNMEPGEVAQHDDQTQQRHISRKGIFDSVPNKMSHNTRVMRTEDKVSGKGSGGGGAGASSSSAGQGLTQEGQQPWVPKKPYAHHKIDNKTRTVQHPGTIEHQVTDTNDQSTVVHQSFIDQVKGILHSVRNGLHTITINPEKGIVSAVQNALHSITMDPKKGIIQSVQNALHSITLDTSGINLKSAASIIHQAQTIADTASSIAHNGPTSVTGTLGVSGLASLAGGLGTGALEVAKDSDGGLVQATMGLEVIGGLDADDFEVSGPATINGVLTAAGGSVLSGSIGVALSNFANDAAAATGGIAVGQLYRNASAVMVRVS